jgi:UDP-2-acetamido-2,6-beta-L-arabino-hexul-4-ose reductase
MRCEVVCSLDIGIDSPPGYTHNILNVGDLDMMTLMWENEVFDRANTDIFRLEV